MATGVVTSVISKTVTDSFFLIERIEVGGDNKAEYSVLINNTLNGKKRTYFTVLNESFFFGALRLETGDTLEVKVIHDRPCTGNFEARIIGISKL